MAQAQAGSKLYTLTEVAKQTQISMPTVQRYKKLYQSRIPSRGTGRSQRYPAEALDVFRELKKENVAKRGRPRKTEGETASAPPAAKQGRERGAAVSKTPVAKTGDSLLTLTQIGKMTGISYPTLLRYVKTNLSKIPHRGTGRARRFLPGAVAIFKELRGQSRRGRKPKASSAVVAKPAKRATGRRGRPPQTVDSTELLARVKDLEKSNQVLVRELSRIQKKLAKPIRIVWR